jgi:hypothetical protein
VVLRAILDGPNGYQEFIAILNYTERVSEAPASELHDLAASLGPDAEEAYMTTADMLRAEGEARGEARGEAKSLVLMLTVKFGPLPDSVTRTVHGASSDQVQAWTIRAVTAETLDQVFALAAECGSGLTQQIDAAGADDSGQAAATAGRALLAGDDEW